MFVSGEKKKRLSSDIIGQLEDDLEANQLDFNNWNKLIKQVLIKDKEEQVRSVFSKYLSIFKHDSTQWCNYINYEMNRGEFQKVEALFPKCFSITHSVELFRLYVSYVRRVNDVITGGEVARRTVIQAFEFAINKVGIDIFSGPLWGDYLDFLKSWTPTASWEQQQKIDLIRKVYKKFFVVPTENIETSWSQYTKWENEINSSTSSKFISEKSAEFMLARSWNTEWHNITENRLKRVTSPKGIKNKDIKYQLKLWFNWIQLEKANKLQLKDESLVQQRIEYVFKQATMALPFVPELWFKYGKFLVSNNEEANLSRSIELIEEGLILNPRSLLLTFDLCEFYEKDNNIEKIRQTYKNTIKYLKEDYEKITAKIEDIMKRSSVSDEIKDEVDNSDDEENQNSKPTQSDKQTSSTMNAADFGVLTGLEQEQDLVVKSITLLYIKLMIACKRLQGIKEARSVFKEARNSQKKVGYELFVEHALMEHFADNKKTANRIFVVAASVFPTNGDFLLSYSEYLINNSDVDSVRKLIQESDANISKEIGELAEQLSKPNNSEFTSLLLQRDLDQRKNDLKRLFKKYLSFASNILSLDVTHTFARKYEQLFPDDDPVSLFSDRYRISNIDLISHIDLDEEAIYTQEPKSKKRKLLGAEKEAHPSDPAFESESNYVASGELNGNGFQNQQNENGPIGNSIYNLLRVLPNASYFGTSAQHVFNSGKLVELLSNLPEL